jgi:Rrf2 family protein
MSKIINISEAANLALHALAMLAQNQTIRLSASTMAKELKASEHHLSKVLQRLTKAGYINSLRGPTGGFFLVCPPDKVTLLEIYELIDGKLTISNCLFNPPVCSGNNCIFGELLPEVNRIVHQHFSTKTLSDLIV